METTDETLAQSAAGGDREAFSLLLRRNYDRLFGLCFRLTGTRADAEDLTQDICAALPAKLNGFRGQARFSDVAGLPATPAPPMAGAIGRSTASLPTRKRRTGSTG